MKKNIWFLIQDAPPPEHNARTRTQVMAKYLGKLGYNVTIFGASTIHNSDINLITDETAYIVRNYDGIKVVHIKAPSYSGNGFSRRKNLLVFPYRLWRYTKKYPEKPDIIINDLNVIAMWFPFWIAKRYKVPIISEVRDIWPESLISYGYLKPNTMLAKFLYFMERKMYQNSDGVIFSMEGGYNYILEKGLTDVVPKEKAYYINNGVDLDSFNYNREVHVINDPILENKKKFKVVYTGSIRRVNNLGLLLDVAKQIKHKDVIFLIWGTGDELDQLKLRVKNEKISNVIFKGVVEKKYIPFIVSSADINIVHNTPSAIFRFGISANKMFDYFAAGRPVVFDFPCKYNPVIDNNAGIAVNDPTPENIAKAIEEIVNLTPDKYNEYCKNALIAAKKFDLKELTNKLVDVIENIEHSKYRRS